MVPVDYSLDMDDFQRVINKLGVEGTGTQSRTGTAPTERNKVTYERTTGSHSPMVINERQLVSQPNLSVSRLAQCGTPKKEVKEVCMHHV